MLTPVIQLTRLDKPVGIILLLYPTLLGLVVLQPVQFLFSWQGLKYICIFTLGTILMRSAGCIINDFFDADIDAQVTRTQNRPLVSSVQRITKKQALLWFVGFMLCSLALLLFLPITSYGYALIAGLLACSYPLAKRWLVMPQAYLGISFSMGMCMAYTLYRPFDQLLLLLMLANSLWVIAYDTAYAMVDKPDDIKLGIHTSAIYFGKYDKLISSLLLVIYNLIHAYLAYAYQLNALFGLIFVLMLMHSLWSIYYLYRPYATPKAIPKNNFNITKISKDIKGQDYFTVFKQAHWLGLLTLIAWVIGSLSGYSL